MARKTIKVNLKAEGKTTYTQLVMERTARRTQRVFINAGSSVLVCHFVLSEGLEKSAFMITTFLSFISFWTSKQGTLSLEKTCRC